jgi:hypothetical protein
MGLVLTGTAVLALVGAVSLSLLGPWVIKILYPVGNYVGVVPGLLPWYAGAMVPLAVSNVLLNNLLARPTSKWGLGLSVLALGLGYLFALTQFHDSILSVLKTMAVGNLLLLVLCAAFTWSSRQQRPEPEPTT